MEDDNVLSSPMRLLVRRCLRREVAVSIIQCYCMLYLYHHPCSVCLATVGAVLHAASPVAAMPGQHQDLGLD